MERKTSNIKIKMIVSWFITCVWAGVIFYLSSRTAVESTVQSRALIKRFDFLLSLGIFDGKTISYIDGIVRECAHGVEYFILGALLYNALYSWLNYRNQDVETECSDKYIVLKCIVYALIMSAIYALSDEIHQIYIPGRSCQLLDLIIDISGSLLGIVVIWFIYFIKNKIKERRLSLRSHRII